MSGYVDAGYVIAIGTLSSYGAALLRRERRARGAARSVSMSSGEDATSRLLSMTEPVVDLGEPPLSR
jgi:hypothetical protein